MPQQPCLSEGGVGGIPYLRAVWGDPLFEGGVGGVSCLSEGGVQGIPCVFEGDVGGIPCLSEGGVGEYSVHLRAVWGGSPV